MCRNLKDLVVGRIPDVEPEERFSQADYIEERRRWLNQVKDEEIAVVALDYNGTKCLVVKKEYRDGRPALFLKDPTTNEELIELTTNSPNVKAPNNIAIIKTYNDMLFFLAKNGIITLPLGQLYLDGLVDICKVLI